jgi:excisionase family DNA binding protein
VATDEPIYTAEQVRAKLGLKSVRTVHRLIKREELDAFTVGRDYRIRESALQAFMSKKRPPKPDKTSGGVAA